MADNTFKEVKTDILKENNSLQYDCVDSDRCPLFLTEEREEDCEIITVNFAAENNYTLESPSAPNSLLYLTPEEMSLIMTADLKQDGFSLGSKTRFERVREMFFVNSNIGLNWADFQSLGRHHFTHIKGEGYLVSITSEKTNKELNVLVKEGSKTLSILKSWLFETPHYNYEVFNKNLKFLLKECGISRRVMDSQVPLKFEFSGFSDISDLVSAETCIHNYLAYSVTKGVSIGALSKLVVESH
jgi:hypothetical protein